MRSFLRPLIVVALLAAACEPTIAPLVLPDGLPLSTLTPAQRALLRATLAIDGVLDEATVVLDPDALTISGDLELANVGSGGAKEATLRVYGRATAESEEVLLGLTTSTVTVTPKQPLYLDFKGASFETCGAGVDGACSLLFDSNRNGDSNVVDLVAQRDPAPTAPFLELSPSTLQFSSGIRLGAFGRQVVVAENVGDHAVRIDAIQVAGGQGIGVSLFDPNSGTNITPRRRLTSTDGAADVVIAPGEELFIAVSFAPVNAFLTTAAVQITATDVVTNVTQGTRTKVIANSDGALRPRDIDYVEPTFAAALDVGGGSVTVTAFPATELFSGAEVTSTGAAAGLLHTGSSLVIARDDGTTLSMPADAAFAVDVATGQRFAAALDADDDVDLALLAVADDGTLSVIATSQQQGDSSEAVDLFNDADTTRRVVVVLGRVGVFAPVGVPGALVAADTPLPFRLSCQLTQGPELDDVAPIAPTRGRLDGGETIVLRGRGFYVPATAAGPHVRVTFGGEPVLAPPRIVQVDDGTQIISVVLPSGTNSTSDVLSTVVIENPSTNGGDGQAATLPEGFRYDLPTARITRVAPDVASTTGSSFVTTVRGAFFFDVYGPPVVKFDDVAATDVFVRDSTTLEVTPPAHAAGNAQLTVTNMVFGGQEGAASNAVDFSFVAPEGAAPLLTTVEPTSGTALGGETVTLTGSSFVAGSRAFLGGNEAVVSASTSTTLTIITPPVDAVGPVEVAVVNPDGQTAVLSSAFTFVLPPPSITAAFPARAAIGGDTIVVLTGAGFRDDTTVSFTTAAGALEARNVTRTSSTTLLVTTPPATAGNAELVARNGDGQEASTSFAFFAPVGPPPSALTINPATGNVGGGAAVSLTATGVSEPVVVVFGETVIDNAVVVPLANGRTRLDLTTPPGEAGNTVVSLVNADGQTATTTFTYVDTQDPRLVGLRPGFVHAKIPGDEILGFGEHLSQLGSTAALKAVAVVQTSSLPPRSERVELDVQFGSDGFVSLLIDAPLPAGNVAVELTGAGVTILSEQRIEAAEPTITSASFDEATKILTLVGTSLAGERIESMVTAGIPCVVLNASERFISCRLVGEPDDSPPPFVASIDYGTGTPLPLEFTITVSCDRQECNNHGTCSLTNGVATCVCDDGFSGTTCDAVAAPAILTSATCPLRAAVQSASGEAQAGCVVPPGATVVRLTNDLQFSAAEQPVTLSGDVVVDGGGRTITLNAGTAFVLNGGQPTLRDITIKGTATTNAVIVESVATLDRVSFIDLTAGASALIVHEGHEAVLTGCAFERITTSTGNGGAIMVRGDVELNASRIVATQTEDGSGAVFVDTTGSLRATSTAFHQSTSARAGGALAISGNASPVVLERCSFTGNSSAIGGGAIDLFNANVHLLQSTIAGNNSADANGAGAVMAVGGTLRVSSSTISSNTGRSTGGIRMEGGVFSIKDSIVVRNIVEQPSNTHDLNLNVVPGALIDVGHNIVGVSNRVPASFVAADAALVVPAVVDATNPNRAVMAPAVAVADPSLVRGSCLDLDNEPLTVDQTGSARGSIDCTLGAVDGNRSDALNTIRVDTAGDGASGCTLRQAVESAISNTATGGCSSGGALDRIIFASNVTSVVLTSTIDIASNESLVIDGTIEHDADVVAITNPNGPVFAASSPTTIVGVRLSGDNAGGDGGTLIVDDNTSVRLVEVTVVGGAAQRGGGAFVNGGVLTFFRSAFEGPTGAVTSGEAVFIAGNGGVFVERSSILGVTNRSLFASDTAGALTRFKRASVNTFDAPSTPMFAGPGHIVAHQSIFDAFGRQFCDGVSGGNYTTLGNNIASNASCFLSATDVQVPPGVFERFDLLGGRTRTFSISPTASFANGTSCIPEVDEDQRGRRSPSSSCAPGAYFPVTGSCPDGIVDPRPERVVEQLASATLPFANGVIGTGEGAFGPSIVVADPAGDRFVSCSAGTCQTAIDISSTTTAPIVAVGIAAVFNPPFPPSSEVVILTADGDIHGFEELSGLPTSSGSLQNIDSPIDAVFFGNPVTGGVELVAVGGAAGVGTLERISLEDGSFTPQESIGLTAAAAKGLVFKLVNGEGKLVVRRGVNSTLTASLATINFSTNTLSYSTAILAGTQNGVVSKPTLIVGRNNALWAAQEVSSNYQLSRGAGNVTLNGGIFAATSLLGGNVEGDAAEEFVAVTDFGQVLLFAETVQDTWQPRAIAGGLQPGSLCRFAELGPAQGGLVCVAGSTFQVATLAPGDERCDPDNLFAATPCNNTCSGPP